jgi:hypothetical protein
MFNHRALDPVSQVDSKLRLGIHRQLLARYLPSFGDQSQLFCAGIVNWILVEPPDGEDESLFFEANGALIQREANALHLDSRLALAISTLYTLRLIRLGPKNPQKSLELVDRASDLNICIRSAKELCPTDNAIEFLSSIDQYASALLDVNEGC